MCNFGEIKSHKFFSDINWDDIEYKKIIPEFVPEIKDEYDLKYIDKVIIYL